MLTTDGVDEVFLNLNRGFWTRESFWSTIDNSGRETIFAIMPETAGTTTTGSASTAQAGTAYTASSSLPWHLIPSFKPGETCINDFSRRVTFLAGIWPQDQMALLAPRIAMSCEGSAFQKMVRLDPAKLKVSDTTGVGSDSQNVGWSVWQNYVGESF